MEMACSWITEVVVYCGMEVKHLIDDLGPFSAIITIRLDLEKYIENDYWNLFTITSYLLRNLVKVSK